MLYLFLRTLRNNDCKNVFVRAVNFSSEPQHADKLQIKKVVNVAIIGAPNSGKSTLINKIVDRKICAASNKVHTTTKLIRAMCVHNDSQIIFLDTPGVISNIEQKKYKLPESMMKACYKSLNCADVVGVVHDVSNRWTKDKLPADVRNILKYLDNTPSFLIINKVDVLKTKKQILSLINSLTNGQIAGQPVPGSQWPKSEQKGYSKFSDVFLISALKGEGVNDIKDYLLANAKPANLHYSPEDWTDQTPETLIVEAVRAKFLDFLDQEIPYRLNTILEYYEDNEVDNKIICFVCVDCPSERLQRLISGAGGGRLEQIRTSVRSDLIDLFKKPVTINIKLRVKDKPNSLY